MRPTPMSAALTLSVLAVLASLAPGVDAQVPNLQCLNCDVEIAVVEWNGTGAPGTFVSGTVRIQNTGESTDSYTIAVNASNPEWVAQPESDNTGDLPPGSGLLAEDGNTFDVQVIVLVPKAAAANAESGVTITATSDNDDTVSATTSVVATATQVHAWQLDCTPNLAIQKTDAGNITLEATNTGNGPDGATIKTVGINGLAIDDPDAITAAAGATARQDLDVGVGLSLEDGEYTLRWNLTSTKSPTTHATCKTTITVTGGTATDGGGPGGANDSEDSPAPAGLMPLLALTAAAAAARTRRRT